MKIATIIPTADIWLEDEADYHLCLAHQVKEDLVYAFFFRKQAKEGRYVILDNGAAENGVPMRIDELIPVAEMIGCQEMVLPDKIYDAEATVRSSGAAITKVRKELPGLKLMAVPHGKDIGEWKACVYAMLLWSVGTIGISKFIAPKIFPSRVDALLAVPELIGSHKDIHLLGYTGIEGEIAEIEKRFPSRIRGVDSSIPTLYAQIGKEMEDSGRPVVELNLNAMPDEDLLKRNIRRWKELCSI